MALSWLPDQQLRSWRNDSTIHSAERRNEIIPSIAPQIRLFSRDNHATTLIVCVFTSFSEFASPNSQAGDPIIETEPIEIGYILLKSCALPTKVRISKNGYPTPTICRSCAEAARIPPRMKNRVNKHSVRLSCFISITSPRLFVLVCLLRDGQIQAPIAPFLSKPYPLSRTSEVSTG